MRPNWDLFRGARPGSRRARFRDRVQSIDPRTTTLTLSLRRPAGTQERTELVELDDRFRAVYDMGAQIGRGAMGAVYRAVHRATGRDVAIKVLTSQQSPEMLKRFLLEGQLMARIEHPRVVRVYDLDRVGEHPYMAMELVDGGSLRAELARRGRLPPREAVALLCECLEGLAACHAAAIVHRDFKPDNVLLDREGRPRIADLGLAFYFVESERLTEDGLLVGTPRYMAPEQALGQEPTRATDVYAAGLMLFEMLAGRVPFEALQIKEALREILSAPLPDLRQLAPGTPEPLVALVERALSRDAGARPSDAAAMLVELEQVRDTVRPVASEVLTPVRRTPRHGRAAGGQPTDRLWRSLLASLRRAGVAGFVIWIAGLALFAGWALRRVPEAAPVAEAVRPEHFDPLLSRLRAVAGRQRELDAGLLAADRTARVMSKDDEVARVRQETQRLRALLDSLLPDLSRLATASSAPPALRMLVAAHGAMAEIARDRIDQVKTWVNVVEEMLGRVGISALSNVDILPVRAIGMRASAAEAGARCLDLLAEWARGVGLEGDLPGCLADVIAATYELSALLGSPRFPPAAQRGFERAVERAMTALRDAPTATGADAVVLAWTAARADDPRAAPARKLLLARLAELKASLPAEAAGLAQLEERITR